MSHLVAKSVPFSGSPSIESLTAYAFSFSLNLPVVISHLPSQCCTRFAPGHISSRVAALHRKHRPLLLSYPQLDSRLRMDSLRRSSETESVNLGVLEENAVAAVGAPLDVVILSNGPGEVGTWVKPVVIALRELFQSHFHIRISVVLSPCPHASGKELELVQSFKEVDRCQGPDKFWQLLVFGRTADHWDWYKKGVCIFLGGDQFYAVMIGKLLGYKVAVYAHEKVRWPGLVDICAVSKPELIERVPGILKAKCHVVGDLFWDAVYLAGTATNIQIDFCTSCPENHVEDLEHVQVLGLLPGSKNAKLAIGVPFLMSVAEEVFVRMGGNVQFMLPLAPTVDLDTLARHANTLHNPFITRFRWASGKIIERPQFMKFGNGDGQLESQIVPCKIPTGHLVTENGVQIELHQEFPPYRIFQQCDVCLTTVGTNTSELGFLAIPMIVLLPTHAMEAFKGVAGGIVGLLAYIPGWLGDVITRLVNHTVLRTVGFISWPNRWAQEAVVPELIGQFTPEEIANIAVEYLKSKEKLETMKQRLLDLRTHRGKHYPGAAHALALLVYQLTMQ